MRVMAKKSILIQTEDVGLIPVVPGQEVSVSDETARDLIRMDVVIDTVKNKVAAKQFLSGLENQPKKLTTVKAALGEFKKTISDFRAATKSIKDAEESVADIKKQIVANETNQKEVMAAIENSDGTDLDQLCIDDSGLKQALVKLTGLLKMRVQNLEKVSRAGNSKIRDYEIARSEVFRCEFEMLIEAMRPQLIVAYAAFDQYSQGKYGAQGYFLSMLHYVNDLFDIDAADQQEVQKLNAALFKGLESND